MEHDKQHEEERANIHQQTIATTPTTTPTAAEQQATSIETNFQNKYKVTNVIRTM